MSDETKSKDSDEIDDVDAETSVDDESNDSDEEQPSIDGDEMADLAAIADDVEEASKENEEDDDGDDASDEEPTESDPSTSTSTSSSTSSTRSNRSWGKMYTKGVVKTSEAIVDEFGDADAEPISEADVRDLELDEAFDEWMAEKTGRPEDIPPGQWVAIGTLLLIGGNALTETDLASEALDGV